MARRSAQALYTEEINSGRFKRGVTGSLQWVHQRDPQEAIN